jgi:DNA-binding beta-propeller fold protein YncE
MKMGAIRRTMLTAILALSALGASADPVQAAAGDPLFIFTPYPAKCLFPEPGKPCDPPYTPPPAGNFNGPCGLGVDSAGNFYVSDYYRGNVNVFLPNITGPPPQNARPFYLTQLAGVDPLSGPCGLALDAADNVYVNVYHRSVVRFGSKANFGTGTPIAGAGVDSTHPTGVAVDPATGTVYVNARTHIAVYDSSGAPVMDGGEPLRIGAGTLGDGYGIAFSPHPGTLGRLYVPDAATDTVKVYDPAVDKAAPVTEIDGSETPQGEFVSLRDAAVAVDRVTGEVYVVDNLEPHFAEQPDAIVHVFGPDGTYNGHLKHLIKDALPPGLAVDNSAAATQGRVYVTSGNTIDASVYAYPPGAATTVPSLPTSARLERSEAPAAQPDAAAEAVPAGLRPPAAAARRAGETQQVGSMLLDVSAQLFPKKLPRDRLAPIAVSIGWKISSTDGSEPPKLKTIEIEINRNGVLDAAGLPACPYEKIQPASTSRALANCRASLVGTGSFSALVGLEGQERYVAKGRMLVFNGLEKGKPVLYGQLYSGFPFANSFVIPFKISKDKSGAYGTSLQATLPANLRAWGNLTEVEMRLSRKYSHRGKRRSFLSASCPTPKGVGLALFRLARTSFSFTGGIDVSSTLTEQCNARR